MAARRAPGLLPLFFFVAFVALPVAMVAARGGANLHSRIQRLWALQISIQSDDPGRVATLDRAADLALLEQLLAPSPRRSERARKMYDSWHARRGWRIYEVDAPRVEVDAGGDSAVARFVLKQSQKRERVRWACRDEWVRRDGTWYLSRRRKQLIDTRSVDAPAPLLP